MFVRQHFVAEIGTELLNMLRQNGVAQPSIVRQRDGAAWWIAAGFLTVSAVWFKQVAAVNVILIGAIAVLPAWSGGGGWAIGGPGARGP